MYFDKLMYYFVDLMRCDTAGGRALYFVCTGVWYIIVVVSVRFSHD